MGAFGATRALKNFTSAAGAALDISRRYKSNLELWVSAGELKAAGKRFCVPRTRMLDGLSHVKLIENGRAGRSSGKARAHASANAAELCRVVQHGDGGRRRRGRGLLSFRTPSIGFVTTGR